MPFSSRLLSDDVAFITGASSGIGAACARRIAASGAAVVLAARRKDRLEQVAATIREETPGAKVAPFVVDVTDRSAQDAFLQEAEAELGAPTILLNNAGGAHGADRVADADPADWDTMLATNVGAVFDLTRKILPGMLARNRGDVVNIASVAGIDPYIGGSVYCASKAAVQAFATSLRKEVLGHDIRVLTFDPGLVETEFSMVRFKNDTDRATKAYQGLRPLLPEDVADCVEFALTRPRHVCLDRMLILATDQSSATTTHRKS